MATVSPSNPLPGPWSLDDLSTELIALILQSLRDADSRELGLMRLASRRLNAIVTPIKYERLRLTERIIAPEAEVFIPWGLQNVYAHTRHVEASSDLNPERLKRVLDQIHRLSSLSWRYARADFRAGNLWMPSDILSSQHARVNHTRLYVEDLPLRDFDDHPQNTYLRAIPTRLLVSLKMGPPTPPLINRLESLKRLLLESRRLESFYYNDRGQGTGFSFAGNERLPAFKDLTLRSYDWNHDSETVQRHWDFSQIRHLNLISVPLFPFLTSVSFADFYQLRTLHCEDYSAHLADRRREATCGLYALVRRVRALHTLKITCHTLRFPLDGLLQHGGSLRALRFRDHVGFGDEERRCPTLRAGDVARLARSLVHLGALEIDMDAALCDEEEEEEEDDDDDDDDDHGSGPLVFVRALARFPRLHTLVLHTQTVIRPGIGEDDEDEDEDDGGGDDAAATADRDRDRDREAAMRYFSALVRGKQEEGGGVPWRSVTINVGGWRRVMLRRMGETWRELNRRGIYAERCFVLERSPAGEIAVREEMPTEI
ncbi:F-box domain-containing protein [Xylariaceae sp. FL0804]|nr:F-box domain-containing protein [Xylariaceae sp. FL0804]